LLFGAGQASPNNKKLQQIFFAIYANYNNPPFAFSAMWLRSSNNARASSSRVPLQQTVEADSSEKSESELFRPKPPTPPKVANTVSSIPTAQKENYAPLTLASA